MRGHFKTGQRNGTRTRVFITCGRSFAQTFFFQDQPVAIYTDFTWAEDMATQGCDQSADSAARMLGAAAAAPAAKLHSGAKAINPRGLGTESPDWGRPCLENCLLERDFVRIRSIGKR